MDPDTNTLAHARQAPEHFICKIRRRGVKGDNFVDLYTNRKGEKKKPTRIQLCVWWGRRLSDLPPMMSSPPHPADQFNSHEHGPTHGGFVRLRGGCESGEIQALLEAAAVAVRELATPAQIRIQHTAIHEVNPSVERAGETLRHKGFL